MDANQYPLPGRTATIKYDTLDHSIAMIQPCGLGTGDWDQLYKTFPAIIGIRKLTIELGALEEQSAVHDQSPGDDDGGEDFWPNMFHLLFLCCLKPDVELAIIDNREELCSHLEHNLTAERLISSVPKFIKRYLDQDFDPTLRVNSMLIDLRFFEGRKEPFLAIVTALNSAPNLMTLRLVNSAPASPGEYTDWTTLLKALNLKALKIFEIAGRNVDFYDFARLVDRHPTIRTLDLSGLDRAPSETFWSFPALMSTPDVPKSELSYLKGKPRDILPFLESWEAQFRCLHSISITTAGETLRAEEVPILHEVFDIIDRAAPMAVILSIPFGVSMELARWILGKLSTAQNSDSSSKFLPGLLTLNVYNCMDSGGKRSDISSICNKIRRFIEKTSETPGGTEAISSLTDWPANLNRFFKLTLGHPYVHCNFDLGDYVNREAPPFELPGL